MEGIGRKSHFYRKSFGIMFHCANNNYSTHYLQSQLSIFFFLSSLGCNEEGVWLSTLIIIKEILLKTIYDILN